MSLEREVFVPLNGQKPYTIVSKRTHGFFPSICDRYTNFSKEDDKESFRQPSRRRCRSFGPTPGLTVVLSCIPQRPLPKQEDEVTQSGTYFFSWSECMT